MIQRKHFWRVGSVLVLGVTAHCGGDGTATGTPPTWPMTSTLMATPIAPAFGMTTNTPRTVQVSASSEGSGQRGFAYTATPQEGDVVFVDGWEVRFSRILVTIKNVRLNHPGAVPTDQSVVGALVVENPTPYAINVQKAGAIIGASGGEETAIPLFVFPSDAQGGALDTTRRYAFSFDIVAATMSATNINLDESDITAYRTMVMRGWTQLIEGTATYRGVAPAMGSSFASYPSTVRFSFGFGAPARYLNCFNPENGAKETPGVQPNANGRVRAQITFHMDHVFWEALGREDPPLHFDHIAARAQTMGSSAVVTLDDLAGVIPTNLRDRMNNPVGDRGAQTRGYTPRNPMVLSLDLGGTSGINDLRDFVTFSTRASLHLNVDGLCAVRPTGAFRY